MEKVLKKYTRIPEHLYVTRDADNELKIIINEMERPGYVLVARQMGKTNLLLNAMRTLKTEDRLLVYVDMSNVFAVEKDCYRYIIDNAIEPNEAIFESIKNEISDIRSQNLPANKEYSKSLNVLLNLFHGDVIIILDEIDALRSAEYSDHIFAQIRSTYFSRTNFPILNRLTYILSGVIEPSELIKDRNKSPFNIGEKIYLNDFSFEEHNKFIEKSKLNVSQTNSKEIFSWTNGNPRLTFDICSEIENSILNNIQIDKEGISDIIKKKYLINFDIPPIDHIRELIKSNKHARDAIISIHNESDDISDELKQKLYLYGIIDSNFNKKTVIKNKIIQESLSLNWINTLEDSQNQVTLTYGLAQYENKEYAEAINTFTKVMSELSPTDSDYQSCIFFLGYSHFYLKKYEEAIKHFSFNFEDEERQRIALSLTGVSSLNTDVKKAFTLLRTVIEMETNDFAYHNALLNLALNLPKEDEDEAFQLYDKLYNSTFKAKDIKEFELNKLRTLALYYQAEIYYENKKTKESIEKIREAKKYASKSYSLYLIFSEYSLQEDKNEDLKKELISKIINNNIKFDKGSEYPISFSKAHLMLYIDLVFDSSNLDLFHDILDYAENNLFNQEKNKFEIVYEVSHLSNAKKVELLNYLFDYKSEIKEKLYLDVLKDLSLLNAAQYSKFFNYFNEFLNNFENVEINESIILLFAIAIKHESDLGNIKKGLELCDIINNELNNIEDEEIIFESLIINYWYANLYFSSNNKELSIENADKTINIINESKKESTSAIDSKGLKDISKQMFRIKDSWASRIPFVSGKKYGRNDRVKVKYIDGKITEGKYKRLEADIVAERCEII